MKQFKISVGDLVSFLYSSGDLSSEVFQNVSLLEGTKAHQYLQSQYESKDQAEVPISIGYQNEVYDLFISGRIDGLLLRDGFILIDEIKSTRNNIFDESFTVKQEHEAQLKMYAYMYMKNLDIKEVDGRVTYIQLNDYKTRYFEYIFSIDSLEPFFIDSIQKYSVWLNLLYEHQQLKMSSLSELVFPFDSYRRGQREMMSAVYQTVLEQDILYSIAPTGIGKTMATLFASLKALNDPSQKIFYLTAKTVGKQIAIDSMDMLHEGTLETKTLELTAKDAICFLEKRECDPEKCPFAKGFFDRLQEATKDIFQHEKLMTRSVVERYARKHTICPFEFSLYVSYFVDVIICDYNYVFDPRTHLIRYFDEQNYKPILLIDEAHNLISRSRDMYSSQILKSDLIKLRRLGSKLKPTIRTGVKHVLDAFDGYEGQLLDQSFITFKSLNNDFYDALRYLMKKVENALKENPKYSKKNDVLDSYFAILGFTKIYEYYNDAYLTNVERIGDDISVTIQCLDASKFLIDIIKNKAYGTVFFSATMYPLDYYKELLTQNEGETLKIQSPFDHNRLKMIMLDNISTRYQDRNQSVQGVVDTIVTVANEKKGNYIVFFPSYQYLNQVLESIPLDIHADILIQKRDMDFTLRELILEKFKTQIDRTQLAFFVMGGMFAEGIDYIGDMLNGVIVVGVGLPMLNETNNQLKDYYQAHFKKGFDYAYRNPGMNKVIQAVGRVIRTPKDYGIAILIDDRFTHQAYRKLYPLEWKAFQIAKNQKQLKSILSHFWDSFEE